MRAIEAVMIPPTPRGAAEERMDKRCRRPGFEDDSNMDGYVCSGTSVHAKKMFGIASRHRWKH